MKRQISVAAILAASVMVPVLSSAPANAVSCSAAFKYTGTNISNSTQFSATSTCDGAYAGTAASVGDYVRGRFYKDGGWQVSAYGFVWVSAGNDGWDKVIGNMVTGRAIRGQGANYGQNVSYLY